MFPESNAEWAKWFAAKHAVLARVAGHVQRFQAGAAWDVGLRLYYAACNCRPPWHLGRFLALLQPGVLRDACLLWRLSASDLAELARFAGSLQSLQLKAETTTMPTAYLPRCSSCGPCAA